MSVFSGKDKDLPLLTQFYQIEVPTGWQEAEEYLIDSELDQWEASLGTQGFFEKRNYVPVSDEDAENKRLENLKILAKLHFHTRLVMNYAADVERRPLSVPTALYLSQDVCTRLMPDLISFHRATGVDPKILLSHSRTITNEFADMLRELLGVAAKQVPVSRCASCGSVYVERREIQRWCSLRCSNRERVRRQRQRAAVDANDYAQNEAVAARALESGTIRPLFSTAQNVPQSATAPPGTTMASTANTATTTATTQNYGSGYSRRRTSIPPANDFDDNDGLSDPFAE